MQPRDLSQLFQIFLQNHEEKNHCQFYRPVFVLAQIEFHVRVRKSFKVSHFQNEILNKRCIERKALIKFRFGLDNLGRWTVYAGYCDYSEITRILGVFIRL